MSEHDRRDEAPSAASAAEESSAALVVLGAYRDNVVGLSAVLEKLAQRSAGAGRDAPTEDTGTTR